MSVTVALAEPFGPVAVTVKVGDAGIAFGAVYKPEELIVPAVAVQPVAPEEVNCWLWLRSMEAVSGDICCVVVPPLPDLNGTLSEGPHRVPGFSTWKTPACVED